MASSSLRFTWCACRKHKIQPKDTHEVCLHCLGIQHAKEAFLEHGKCPHCAKMDWGTCINRLTKVQEVMHQESQQRKHEAAQSGHHPKPESTSALITDSRPLKEAAQTPSLPQTPMPVQSSTLPVMLTILSPSQVPSESSSNVVKGTFLSHLAIQQSADCTPSTGHSSSLPMPSTSHKRRHASRCHSHCFRHSGRRCGHRQTRSPSFSSVSCWSSSESSSDSVKEKRSRRESKKSIKLIREQSQLLDIVQQKLEAQQQSIQIQWSMIDRRIEALEKRGTEASTASPSSAGPLNSSQTSTSSQEELQRDWSGSTSDVSVTEPRAPVVIKQEDKPSSISSVSKQDLASEGDREQESSLLESSMPNNMFSSKELQLLIGRAAKYLGIDFPKSPTSSKPQDPTMVPEFEELVQSTWSNPASSKPYREIFTEMYRLHGCQSPAYDHMPQVNGFMSAIFQAVKPPENKESAMPSEHWHFTESIAERIYQTAGMLAKTANYLRYLSDYQNRLLMETTNDRSAQRFEAVLNELKLIGQYTHQLSSHQAELSGRVMAASVAARRQIWMAKTKYTDALKATVADLPFVVQHTVGTSSGST